MAWTFTLDYQDGEGVRDIMGLVDAESILRRRRIWNKLAPTVNTLTFRMKWDSTHMALLMTTVKDILVAVNDGDGSAYFRGTVKPNFSVNTGVRPDYIQIECVDRSWLLQKKIMSNINWAGYTVSNPSTTAASIVHQLMVGAGYSLSDVSSSIPTVAKTIANFIVIKGDTTYWEALQKVTFEFGYTFYFGDDGKLDLFHFAPASVTAAGSFTNANMIGTLGLRRAQREYDGCRVKWYGLKTFQDVVVASDTSGGNGVYKALIAVLASDYYPEASETYSTYIDYTYQDYEVVAVTSASLDLVGDAAISTVVFTDEIKRARVQIANTDGAATKYIYKFDVVGDAICKDTYNWTEAPSPLTSDKVLEVDTQWISAAGDAQTLSDAVSQYHRNVEFTYQLRSRDSYDPGQYADVEESSWLSIDNLCVVVEVVDNDLLWSLNGNTPIRTYTLEGVAAYSAGTTGTSQTAVPPVVPKRTDGYTVAAAGSTMDCDVRCDGMADQTEINAAITLVSGAGGGTVYLVGGQFNVTAAIEGASNVTLWLDSSSTIEKNCDDRAIEVVGTSGTHKTNFYLCGGGSITRNASDTYAQPLVHFEYLDDSYVDNVLVDDSYGDGVYVVNCDTIKLGAGVKITNCAGTGLKVVQSIVVGAAAVAIAACGIGYECWPSLATDMISHGDCESTDEPMLDSETVPYVLNTSAARSNEQSHTGTYSYKITMTSDSAGNYHLEDSDSSSDLHGLTAGKTYLVDMWVWLVSGAGEIAASEVSLRMNDSDSISQTSPRAVYGAWQRVSLCKRFADTATGCMLYLNFNVSSKSGKSIYVDDVHVYEFDDTDSGCAIVNSSVSDCTDTGILIANSHVQVQNNQVTGNTNAGIVIAAGYRNLVTGNRCQNNGSDTGIANDNQDNFYDAGIDTNISGNSWQSPVTGEASWGEPKFHFYDTGSSNPADSDVHEIDLSGQVPVGAKGVAGFITSASGTLGDYVIVTDSTGTNTYGIARVTDATTSADGFFFSPLTSARSIYVKANNSRVTDQRIRTLVYFS